MKTFAALLSLSLLALTPLSAAAQTPDPAVMAPVNQLADGFAHNDGAKIFGAHAPSPTIIDEFAPYFWTGPAAVQGWGGDFAKFSAGVGVTGGSVALAAPTTFEVSGDHAYVVCPSVITFTTKTGQMKNAGSFTFALVKMGDAWKVQSWAYARGVALP
jgi:hypothetical protein